MVGVGSRDGLQIHDIHTCCGERANQRINSLIEAPEEVLIDRQVDR